MKKPKNAIQLQSQQGYHQRLKSPQHECEGKIQERFGWHVRKGVEKILMEILC